MVEKATNIPLKYVEVKPKPYGEDTGDTKMQHTQNITKTRSKMMALCIKKTHNLIIHNINGTQYITLSNNKVLTPSV